MGSSPFTATTLPVSSVANAVRSTVAREVERDGSSRWIVAFSGGPDSTALAWALGCQRPRLDITLVHVDHGLDGGSAGRAARAARIARQLDLPCRIERLPERAGASRDESGRKLGPEAWARHHRYAVLRRLLTELRAQRIATAHHADDQAETLLLRLAYGTGLSGLSGIRRRHGAVIRPLLDLRRRHLVAALEQLGLTPLHDPTNLDLARPRNRIRHKILPEWNKDDPTLVNGLNRLSTAAARANDHLLKFFTVHLRMERMPSGSARLDRPSFEKLPAILQPFALSTLERLTAKGLPTPASARAELLRQLTGDARIGCDAGGGWRWHGDGRSLRLVPPQKPLTRFTYTVAVPGSAPIVEIGALLRITVAPAERLEVADRASTAFLRPPSTARHHVEIRNRRPGDRLRPAGRRRERRLKELLIDQRIPREQRDRLPLVVLDGRIAWVPGVALDERFRAEDNEPALKVEWRWHDKDSNEDSVDGTSWL